MRQAPHYSADRFPVDFVASAVMGLVSGVVCGLISWHLARLYLQQTYPGHRELLSAAIVIGVVDGFLFCIGGFIATFAIRILRYERQQRRRSDQALRRELESIHGSGHDRPGQQRRA